MHAANVHARCTCGASGALVRWQRTFNNHNPNPIPTTYSSNMSLRAKQIATLERMLHLNADGPTDLTLATKTEPIVWKALILDPKAQSIVSSVLRVNDLLRCGVTLHLTTTAARSPLPDVPAIYFLDPTPANVALILADVARDCYESFYINFTSSIPRELLEHFAKQVSLNGNSHKIKQVYDQYLNYLVTEPNLFSLDSGQIFSRFNHPATLEDQIHRQVDELVLGLLSVVLTSGNVPIIRCQRNGPAELVATQLDLRLRDHLANSRSTLALGVRQRGVLVLVDRNIDLLSMFAHSWIYQCMISDVFDLRRNTIRIGPGAGSNGPSSGTNSSTSGSKSGPASGTSYDIDPNDFFWRHNAQLPFPDVVENANVELEAYKKDAHDLTAQTGITSLHDIDSAQDTNKIQQAVDALPELTTRKATLDMHMDVLASLLKELEAKSLDKFFEIEQNLNNAQIQQEFLELLHDNSKKDNTYDKLRTFIIIYLMVDTLSPTFVKEVKQKLADLDPNLDLAGLNYIEKFKEMAKLSNLSSLTQMEAPQNNELNLNNNSALFNNLSSRLYGLTEGRLTEGLSSLTSGLKKLLPNKKNLPITNIVESIMDPASAHSPVQVTDDYLYLDPKLRGGHSKPPKRQSYHEAVVFVVGGGNYLEYQNLQEYGAALGREIVYGSLSIMTAREFLDECALLGQ